MGEIIDTAIPCCKCGKQLQLQGYNPLRCALSEATRGHNLVRDQLLHLFHIADSAASIEVPGLIASRPLLRPDDIHRISALPGGRAALDVGIATPGTCTGGEDYCDSMWTEKMKHYESVLPEMQADGLHYVPLVFSCFG